MSSEIFRRNIWCAVLNDIRGLEIHKCGSHTPRDTILLGGGGCCSRHPHPHSESSRALCQCLTRTITWPPSKSKTKCPAATPWRERDSIQNSSAKGGGSTAAAATAAAAAVAAEEEDEDAAGDGGAAVVYKLITPVSTALSTPEPGQPPAAPAEVALAGKKNLRLIGALQESSHTPEILHVQHVQQQQQQGREQASPPIEVNNDADANNGGDGVNADDDTGGDLPECPICFCEIESASETWSCSNAGYRHTHVACTTCVQHHIRSRVEEGMLVISCPVEYAACSYTLTQQEVERLALPEDLLALEAITPKKKKKGSWFKRKAKGSSNSGSSAECKEKEAAGEKQKEKMAMPPRESIPSKLRTWWHKKRHTRQCRKCLARIEKNGGCAHMTCRCGHEICWRCGGNYVNKDGTRGHGGDGDVLNAAFPAMDEWKHACHSTKLWAIRICGIVILVGVVLPLGVSIACIALPAYGLYALWKWSKKKWARRKERLSKAERAR